MNEALERAGHRYLYLLPIALDGTVPDPAYQAFSPLDVRVAGALDALALTLERGSEDHLAAPPGKRDTIADSGDDINPRHSMRRPRGPART